MTEEIKYLELMISSINEKLRKFREEKDEISYFQLELNVETLANNQETHHYIRLEVLYIVEGGQLFKLQRPLYQRSFEVKKKSEEDESIVRMGYRTCFVELSAYFAMNVKTHFKMKDSYGVPILSFRDLLEISAKEIIQNNIPITYLNGISK